MTSSHPQFKRHRQGICVAIDKVVVACEESISFGRTVKDVNASMIKGLQAGACERALEICADMRKVFEEYTDE